jgi:AraC-like DNA-binding protein
MSTERVAIHGFGFVHACLTPRAATQHALPAHKLVVPLEGAVLSYVGDEHPECVVESRAPLLVAAGVRHSIRANGPSVGILVPALVAQGRAVRARATHEVLTGRAAQRVEGLAAQLHEGLALDGAEEAIAAVTRDLLASTPVQRRVAALLAGLEEHGPARPSLEALAVTVQLSPSRLSHLFAAETGTSLRAWLSFRRAFLAVRALATGERIAQVASVQGYADQPHLTRELRQHFGRSPNEIRSVFVQDPASPAP